jgi:gamma-glutamylcyclotransferase (GGCT)/AIG2-like uncharacterized protein YtfP
MAPQPAYLFVYGTLRSKVDIPVKQEIGKSWELIGESEITGNLYDMGDYPALVPGNNTIKGEVYLVHDPEKVFGLLDSYEGYAYKRKQETVTLPDGNTVQAWVYWYQQSVEGKSLIGDKDYIAYIEKKGRVY